MTYVVEVQTSTRTISFLSIKYDIRLGCLIVFVEFLITNHKYNQVILIIIKIVRYAQKVEYKNFKDIIR